MSQYWRENYKLYAGIMEHYKCGKLVLKKKKKKKYWCEKILMKCYKIWECCNERLLNWEEWSKANKGKYKRKP